MPRTSPGSSDDSASEDVIMPKSKTKIEDDDDDMDDQKEDNLNAHANGDDEDDEDDEEGEEVTYVVEKIVQHVEDHGVIKYEVQWQGYSSSENTWEPEDNLDGAKDILQAYFKKIGGRPEVEPKGKKRGRKSVNSQDITAKKPKFGESMPARRGRKSKNTDDEEQEIKWGSSGVNWEPPPPTKDAWEDRIVSIETIEAGVDGKKWAFLLWADEDETGKKRTSKAMLESVHKAAPQAMLKFYESHLVFTEQASKKASD